MVGVTIPHLGHEEAGASAFVGPVGLEQVVGSPANGVEQFFELAGCDVTLTEAEATPSQC